MANIVFCETTPLEKKYFKDKFAKHAVSFYEQPIESVPKKALEQADVVSVFVHSKASKDVLSQIKNLTLITTRSTGFDHIDTAYCASRGILVAHVPSYGEITVAEHAFALMLYLAKNMRKTIFKELKLPKDPAVLRGFELYGKTLGVLGTGAIGKHAIVIAKGFGMNVIAYDAFPDAKAAKNLGFTYVSLQELLKTSDIISLHIPYLPQTHHIIDKKALKRMKHGAIIINTARGALIDTGALFEALRSGHIAGAGLDVIEGEEIVSTILPLKSSSDADKKAAQIYRDNELLKLNVVFTPHNAYNTVEAMHRIMQTTETSIREFLTKRPITAILKPKK